MVDKIKRRGMIAAVCLDAGGYLVSGTGVDAQFKIGKVVGDGVGSRISTA